VFESTENKIKKKFNALPDEKLHLLISLFYASVIKPRRMREAYQSTTLLPVIPYS
jgi:hypothetical protein